MIIELDDQFYDVDFAKDAQSRNGIESICLSVARGEHFLLSSRAVINRIANDRSLSITARGVASFIKSNYSFLVGMLKDFRYRITVTLGSDLPKRLAPYRWAVSIDHLARTGVRPTVLLGENSNDGDIYIHAGYHYRIHTQHKDVQIKIEPRNGNGGSVSSELDRISTNACEFCLCLTDSDRLCPTSSAGVIATATQKIAEKSGWIVSHDAPFSRELENAIPSTIVDEAISKLAFDHVAEFEASASKLGVDAVRFADLKFGTSVQWINSVPANSPTRSFWDQNKDLIYEKGNTEHGCDTNFECKAEKCKCFVMPKIAKDVAAHAFEYMKNASAHEVYRRAKSSYNFSDWLRLGKEVLEAGAAPRPMRA